MSTPLGFHYSYGRTPGMKAANTNHDRFEAEHLATETAQAELAALRETWRRRAAAKLATPVVVALVHRKYGPARHGLAAHVVAGQSILLVGEERAGYRSVFNPSSGRHEVTTAPQPIARTFRVGDEAEYGSHNLVYTGTITAITTKTVTIVEDDRAAKAHRLSLYDFAEANYDFDAAKAHKRNAEWMD
jgi:hypothetical protein